jgi:hypothetical protein
MQKVIVLTGSYADSGLKGLEPVGILMGYHGSSKHAQLGRVEAVEKLKIEAEAAGCTHVFNVRFESWGVGHPNNSEYGSRATGDAYRSKHRDVAPAETQVEIIPYGDDCCRMKCRLCNTIIAEGPMEELADLRVLDTHMAEEHSSHPKSRHSDGTQRS